VLYLTNTGMTYMSTSAHQNTWQFLIVKLINNSISAQFYSFN